MAIPIITQPASPRIIAQGVAFTLSLSATESPDTWAATGLPSGLTINESTGEISGTPLAAGQSTASISATNIDGTSAPVSIVFVVMATPPGAQGNPFDLLLDYEVSDGKNAVTIPGVDPPAAGVPLFAAPRGTNRYLLVGVKSFGVLQDVNPNNEDVAIKLALKEDETERLLEITMGETEKIADMPDDMQRYRVPFRITPANWTSPLSDYEDPAGTKIMALAELQVQVGEGEDLYDSELEDTGISLEGGMSAGVTGDHDFTGIEQFSEPTPMRLTLTMTVAGRPLQAVELVRDFDLKYTGGSYVVSNASGDTSGQGEVEGGKWRATLQLTGLTGDSDSLKADYKITTTDDETVEYYVWELDLSSFLSGDLLGSSAVSLASPTYLTLWDGASEQMGLTSNIGGAYEDPAGLLSAIEAAWNDNGGSIHVAAIQAVSASVVRIEVPDTTSVRKVGLDDADPPETSLIDPIAVPGPEGEGKSASVKARLEQLESAAGVPLNLTSNQFLIEVARDMAPD